jgi:signal transduction histidine kinase
VKEHPAESADLTGPRSAPENEEAHKTSTNETAEREALSVSIRTQAQRQAALLRLSAELAAALDEDQVCQLVASGLYETLGYDNVALYLVDEATGDRVRAAVVGLGWAAPRLVPGQGLTERPLLDGKLHYTPDVTKDPRWVPGLGGAEVDVPVHIGGKALGVLVVESRQPDAFNQDDFEVLTAAAQQAGLAIDRIRLLVAERRRADELEALRTTMTDITAELELPVLLRAIVERAVGLLDAGFGELGLYDTARKEVKVVVCHNLDQGFVGKRHPVGEGAMGRVAETGEPLIIRDYRTWEGRAPRYVDLAAHSALAAPLKVGDRLVGVIVIAKDNPDSLFDAPDLHRLDLFAQQAAIAIENARLLAAERQRADELEALRTTIADITAELDLPVLLQALVERAVGLLDATGGELGLYDEESQEVRIAFGYNTIENYSEIRHRLGEGAMGAVAETGEPLIIKDYQTWSGRAPQYADTPVRTTLATPLQVGNRLVGVIGMTDSDPEREFGPADLHLLNLFARQAAIAIENARLYDQAQQAAVVEERSRLARELHDSVTQSLYSLTLLAEAGQRSAGTGDMARVARYLLRLGEIGQQALKEMRLLVYQLRPLALETEGLVGALQQRLDAVERRAGVRAQMLVNGDADLPPAVEECLFRIAQEALNNALKHAAHTHVTVTIRSHKTDSGGHPSYIELEVKDDGSGFDPDAIPDEGGMGLISMRERVEKLGGSFMVRSTPGEGTTVKVRCDVPGGAGASPGTGLSSRMLP